MLKDKNDIVHQQTKNALHEIGPATKDEMPAIIDALKDQDENEFQLISAPEPQK